MGVVVGFSQQSQSHDRVDTDNYIIVDFFISPLMAKKNTGNGSASSATSTVNTVPPVPPKSAKAKLGSFSVPYYSSRLI